MKIRKKRFEDANDDFPSDIGCQVNRAVMLQVARNMTDNYDGILKGRRFFVCGHDPLYTKESRKILTDSCVEISRLG
ncbi:hypothetical protein DDZ13_07805 [Coraliomargarita sinensis]|uniref:Uncharacterized protein n=1 Tax=Coraliomargarita sinensis TaxID=2174842 RepID=A0A317ZJL7_9BACT|nr:hypothetical protein [Coraliomargarita sinensis]PXA04427.1 hypothetical protein DDZ13_07805 [Coraliomargarita sinensis]